MKKILQGILLLFIQLASITIIAQEAKPVQFANGNFKTNSNIANGLFKNEDIRNARYNDVYYVLVQFSQLPSAATKQRLEQEGILLDAYLPGNAYLAIIKIIFDNCHPMATCAGCQTQQSGGTDYATVPP